MFKVFVAAMTLVSILNVNAACVINAQTKSDKAKSVYVNGVTLSKKVVEALSSQCEIKTSVMSNTELLAMLKLDYDKRVAKLTK